MTDLCTRCGIYDPASQKPAIQPDGVSNVRSNRGIMVCRLPKGRAANCPLCHLLADAFEAWRPKGRIAHDDVESEGHHDARICYLPDGGLRIMELNNGYWWNVSLYLHPTSRGHPLEHVLASRDPIAADTRTEGALDRAAAWMSECVAHHAKCTVPYLARQSSQFTPRRLLEVQAGGGSNIGDDDDVRLVEDPTGPVLYAALSYCWGPDGASAATMTTRATKEAHIRGIAMGSLPRTVRDGVVVCRRLGIPYLWVDALCIVQDDAADWRREAAQMGQVYMWAEVVVAAEAAVACVDGFLGRQLRDWRRQQLVFRTAAAAAAAAAPTEVATAQVLLHAFRSNDQDKATALNVRGWTLQETVLPRRVLHFFDHEMLWECQTAQLCECGHAQAEDLPGREIVGTKMREDLDCGDDGGGRGRVRNSVHKTWTALVSEYSGRLLTRQSDKLIAIDGLAQVLTPWITEESRGVAANDMERGTHESSMSWVRPYYVAGLFRSHLAEQLLWEVFHHRKNSDSNSVGISESLQSIPSWSWAAVNQSVIFKDKYNTQSLLAVDGVETCVPSGHIGLRVRGRVVPVVMRSAEWRVGWQGPDKTPIMESLQILRTIQGGSVYSVRFDAAQPSTLSCTDPAFPCWLSSYALNDMELRATWRAANRGRCRFGDNPQEELWQFGCQFRQRHAD